MQSSTMFLLRPLRPLRRCTYERDLYQKSVKTAGTKRATSTQAADLDSPGPYDSSREPASGDKCLVVLEPVHGSQSPSTATSTTARWKSASPPSTSFRFHVSRSISACRHTCRPTQLEIPLQDPTVPWREPSESTPGAGVGSQ